MGKTNKTVAAAASQWVSGFCGNGNHEAPGGEFKHGERPKVACKGKFEASFGGKVTICTCHCHAKITELFETMGVERAWPTSNWRSPQDEAAFSDAQPKFDLSWLTEWRAPHTPEPLPENAEDLAPDVKAVDGGESGRSINEILPPNPAKPNGWEPGEYPRPAGALEWQVKLACDQWVLGAYPNVERLTPLNIVRIINDTRAPSTGAITNILVGWNEIGFAKVQLEAPRYFIGYTEAGLTLGVEKLRERHMATKGAASRAASARLRTGAGMSFKRR